MIEHVLLIIVVMIVVTVIVAIMIKVVAQLLRLKREAADSHQHARGEKVGSILPEPHSNDTGLWLARNEGRDPYSVPIKPMIVVSIFFSIP